MILRFTQNTDTEWAEKSYEVGHIQFILCDKTIALEAKEKSALALDESRTKINITCGETKYVFDKITGRIISVNNGTKLLKEPLSFSIDRIEQSRQCVPACRKVTSTL